MDDETSTSRFKTLVSKAKNILESFVWLPKKFQKRLEFNHWQNEIDENLKKI
jgi:hypothetical protein